MRALELDVERRHDLWGRLARGMPSKVLCLAECCFHAVEAPVEVNILEKLDEFEVFLLRAVQFLRRPSLRELDGLLHLGRQTLRQATTALIENKLLVEDTGGCLEATAKGTAAIESGVATRSERRRLVFHFIHPSNEYVRIHDVRRSTLSDLKREATPRDWHWDVASLQQPIESPDEWKREREFPTNVVRLITKGDLGTDQAPSDNVAGSNEDSQTATVEVSQLEKYLIADKAQAGQCVMVVGFEGDSPVELHAYSLVQMRSSGRAVQRTMFSVRGAEAVMRVLPGLEELHAPERLRDAWQAVARHCGLEDPRRATIRLDEMQIVVGLDGSLAAEWLAFCWQAVRGELHACVDLPGMSCLCMLALEPRDQISRLRLEALRFLYRVRTMHAGKTSFIDSPTFRAQLAEAGYADGINRRELSSLAWQMGEFRLAYHLAELEDMVDVHV
jgi:hypothetical protein